MGKVDYGEKERNRYTMQALEGVRQSFPEQQNEARIIDRDGQGVGVPAMWAFGLSIGAESNTCRDREA